jgi:hypothetical protein
MHTTTLADRQAPLRIAQMNPVAPAKSKADSKQAVKMVKEVKDKRALFWQKRPEKIKLFQYLCLLNFADQSSPTSFVRKIGYHWQKGRSTFRAQGKSCGDGEGLRHDSAALRGGRECHSLCADRSYRPGTPHAT